MWRVWKPLLGQELLTFPPEFTHAGNFLHFNLSSRQELLTFPPEFTPGTAYISTWVHARNCLHFHLSSHQELLTFPPEFTPGILCGACSSIFCGLLCKSLFVLLFSLFICPSIYGFWLPLRYPLTCLSNTW
jgi:hypothetical protein